jgi:hypothetical protein
MASGNADNSSIGDGVIEDAGIDGYSSLYDQLRGMKRERDITSEPGDPNQLMARERPANDAESEGLSGYLRNGVHELYGLFRPDQDPAGAEEEFKSAEQASRSADQNIEATTESNKNKKPLQQLASQLQGESLLAQQSNDRIAALREEARDAELEGEGKTDEARIAALKFQTEQRVRSLQEQPDAEGDSTKRSQLQKEVAAAADAGNAERDALQKELQRQNSQAPALAVGSTPSADSGQAGSSHGEGPNNLADVSKRLDDAATKLDRAISKLKTLAVLKD